MKICHDIKIRQIQQNGFLYILDKNKKYLEKFSCQHLYVGNVKYGRNTYIYNMIFSLCGIISKTIDFGRYMRVIFNYSSTTLGSS